MPAKARRVEFQNGLVGRMAGEEGPPVILLHPIGFTSVTWRFVQPVLARSFRTLALDLLGFGASAKPADVDYSLQAQARRVLQVADELGWDRADLVGNSLGGVVSLAAALEASERVASLVLIGAAAYPGGIPPLRLLAQVPIAEQPLRLTSHLAAHLAISFCYGDRRRLERKHVRVYAHVLKSREGVRAFRLTGQALYGRSLADLSRRYPEIDRPALILHGDRDPIIRRWVPEKLSAELPEAELRWLPGVGHFPQEEAPEMLLDHVASFLLDRDRAAA